MADGSVLIDTKLDSSGLKSGLEGLSGIVSGSGLAKAGAGILKTVTAVSGSLVAMGKFAVDAGMNFDTSMSQVMATMGLTGQAADDAYNKLSAAAKQAGETTQFSAKEAADALNYLALAGYDAETAANVLPSVLDLAAAGAMDLAYASDLATDAMAALGIEANGDNLQHFGDQLAKTASRSNTSVAQLGEAILTVGGTAKQLAGGTVELNTALGVLANRGIKGAEGGTHLRNIILSLTAPTDKAAEAIEALGLKTTDAAGNLLPLDEIMADFNEKTKGMSAAAKMDLLNQIFNKTDLAAVQALLSGVGDEWDNLEREIDDCQGAMHAMAETQLDNLEGDITIMKSALEGLGIAAYEGVKEPLRKIVQLGTNLIGQLTNAMKTGGFAGLAGALGDVFSQVVTKAAEYLPKVVSMAMQVIQAFVKGISANAGVLASAALEAMSSISEGVMLATPDLMEAAGSIALALGTGMADRAPALIASLATMAETLAAKVQDFVPKFILAAKILINSIAKSIKKNLPSIIKSLTMMLLQGLKAFISVKTDLMKLGFTIIEAIGDGLIEAIPDINEALPSIISGIANFFSTQLSTMVEIGTKLFSALSDNLPQIFSGVWNAIAGIDWVGLGKKILKAIWDGLCKIGDSILSLFGTSIKDITGLSWGDIYTAITGAFTSFGSWFLSLFTGGKSDAEGLTWGDIFTKVKDGFAGLGAWFLGLFTGGKSEVEKVSWSEVGTSIETGIQTVLDAGGKFLEGIFTAGKALVEAINWGNLGTVIGNGVNGVIDLSGKFLEGCFTAGKALVEEISWDNLGKVIGNGVNSTVDLAGEFLEGCFKAGKALVEKISWENLGTTIANGVNGTIDLAGEFLEGSFKAGKALVEKIEWSGLGTAIATGVNGAIDVGGKFLEGWFKAGKTLVESIHWEGIGTAIATGINGTIDTAGAFLEGWFKAGKTLVEGIDWANIGKVISSNINNYVDTAGKFLSGCFDAAKSAIKEIKWSEVGTTIGNAVNETIDTAGKFLSKCFEAGKSAIEAFPWAETGQKVGQLAGQLAAVPLNALSGAFTTANEAITNFPWAETGKNLGGLAGDITNLPLAWLRGIFSLGKSAAEAFPWEETGKNIGELSGKIVNVPLKTLSGVFTGAQAAVEAFPWDDTGTKLGTLAGQIVDVGADLLGDMFTSAAETIKGIEWDEIGQQVADGLNRAWGIVSGLGDAALSLGEGVSGAAQGGAAAFKEWALGLFRGADDPKTESDAEAAGKKIVTDLNAGVTGHTSDLVTTGEQAGQVFLDAVKSKLSPESMSTLGTNALGGLVRGFSIDYREAAETSFSTTAKALHDKASDELTLDKGKTIGEAFGSGIKTGISNKETAVKVAGQTVMGAAYLAMQAAIGGAHGTAFNVIGTAICAGIAQGIKNGTSAVTIAATNAAISAYNAAKRSLQINSPSKVFEKLFQYVPLGAAKGIDDNASKVEESVSRLADSLASPDIAARMQAAVSRNASGFADILADSGSVHATETQNQQPIDYNQLAKAIWDEAPDIGFNVDSVRMADLLEPRISEKQATNTQNKVRRGE